MIVLLYYLILGAAAADYTSQGILSCFLLITLLENPYSEGQH